MFKHSAYACILGTILGFYLAELIVFCNKEDFLQPLLFS